MPQDNGTAALLGGGSTSFPFPTPGSRLTGKVTHVEIVDQTYLDGVDKGKVIYWDEAKSKPKRAVTAVVQTDPPIKRVEYTDPFGVAKVSESEDGRWGVFFSGHKFTALKNAAPNGLYVGDEVDITMVNFSDRAPKERGHNPAKLYTITVTPAPVGTGPLDASAGGETGTPPSTTGPAAAPPTPSGVSTPAFGDKPEGMPDAAWAALPDAAKAIVSPYVAKTPILSAGYGDRPFYLPEAAWDAMDAAARAAVSPPVTGTSAVRPDYIPEAVWAVMPEEARKAASAPA